MGAKQQRYTDWQLTRTELALLFSLIKHLDYDKAAEELGIERATVRFYLHGIKNCMGVGSTLAAIVIFDRWADTSEDVDRLKKLLAIP